MEEREPLRLTFELPAQALDQAARLLEAVRLLLEAGCEEGQGYLFSMPLSIEDYEKFVYLDEEVDG